MDRILSFTKFPERVSLSLGISEILPSLCEQQLPGLPTGGSLDGGNISYALCSFVTKSFSFMYYNSESCSKQIRLLYGHWAISSRIVARVHDANACLSRKEQITETQGAHCIPKVDASASIRDAPSVQSLKLLFPGKVVCRGVCVCVGGAFTISKILERLCNFQK